MDNLTIELLQIAAKHDNRTIDTELETATRRYPNDSVDIAVARWDGGKKLTRLNKADRERRLTIRAVNNVRLGLARI